MTEHPAGSSRARRLLIGVLLLAAVIAVGWFVFAGLPWAEIGQALRDVSLGQLLVLLGLVLVRAVVLALPLSALMREVSPLQATRTDLAGNLVANFAPPPADIGIRYAMFRSWKVNTAEAMAALSLSALLFYAARFTAPLLGFSLILLTRRFDDQYLLIAVMASAVALLIIGALIVISRAERSAAWLGRTAGSLVARVRDIDPANWEQATLAFREKVNDRLQRGWGGAAVALLALFVVESIILVVALRFVEVPSDAVPTVEIAGALLATYPLNMLPFGGLVLLDGAILEILSAQGGAAFEAQIGAGLVLWRLATLLTPFILGLLVLLHWQRHEGRGIKWRQTVSDPESS
ncbi:MAG: lysylphosphatidylglycerol synthase domain-containing protein [Jiangellales bacterium]